VARVTVSRVSLQNEQIKLAARPVGLPDDSTWEYVEEAAPEPGEGEIRVEVEYLSVDPAMRGWLSPMPSYVPPVEIGEVMRAGGVAKVIDSNHEGFAVGDAVSGGWGVQKYAVSDGKGVHKVDLDLAPAPVYVGTLGISGLTAYFGLLDIGKAKEGDTVVVSGAAGSVGMLVGQIARIIGCRVVGIAGGPEKCAWITDELGFDAAIDYRSENVRRSLKTAAPDGVDVFFDNVGGKILEAGLARLNRGARVVLCGAISQYNATEPPPGPSNYMQLLITRSTMEGFVVFDFASRYPEGAAKLAEWLKSGELKSREYVVEGGVKGFPEALLKLFSGENTGKLVLKI
jgi:NADPH-dependent curcumin reductase CurA